MTVEVDAEEKAFRRAVKTVVDSYGKEESLSALLEAGGSSESNEKSLNAFCHELIDTIRTCVSSLPASNAKETALVRFHQLRITKLPSLWTSVHENLSVTATKAVLTQSVNRQLFNDILLEHLSSQQRPSTLTSPVASILSEEEQAIRYASGYVSMRLIKRFKKEDASKAEEFVECLSNMAVDGEDSSFYAYTKEWTKGVNRGGLFETNEATFLFFRAVEVITQACLPRHLQHAGPGSTKEHLIRSIVDDDDVQFFWSMLSVDISQHQRAQELLQHIVELWVTIRGFAMTSYWTEEYKKATEKTTKKSKSLRKGLKGKSTE